MSPNLLRGTSSGNITLPPGLMYAAGGLQATMARLGLVRSVRWLRRLTAWEGEQAAVEYRQAKSGGGQRGLVEIAPEAP